MGSNIAAATGNENAGSFSHCFVVFCFGNETPICVFLKILCRIFLQNLKRRPCCRWGEALLSGLSASRSIRPLLFVRPSTTLHDTTMKHKPPSIQCIVPNQQEEDRILQKEVRAKAMMSSSLEIIKEYHYPATKIIAPLLAIKIISLTA